MKLAGIIGGLGPESTIDYYQSIISKYQKQSGSIETLPPLIINSINMYNIFEFIESGQIAGLIDYLVIAVERLEKAGVDFAVISANTPHIVFDEVQRRVQVPLYSIVEETFAAVEAYGVNRIGLLGTKFTMEHDFFKRPFANNGKEIFVPDQKEQQYIHQKIVEELENGIVNSETKSAFLDIVHQMILRDNIEGVILGCTELPMIIKPEDIHIAQFNTTEIHVDKIVESLF